jgi:hypothetical protein
MAVTRIKNNQITDSTITYQKIASGTLTGGLFNANLTLNSNVSIVGNLQVTGNTTTVNSIDTLVNDPLITLNNGYVGSPAYDVGILFNRALGSIGNYGGKNAALVWSETDGAFIVVLTTETGTTSGVIDRSFKANLIAGNLTVANAIVAQSANISSLVTGSLTLSSLRATGNILADAGTISTTYTTGAIVVPNDGGVGIGGNLNVRGTSDFTGNITAGNILVSGNINVTVGAVASSYGVFYGNAAGIGALYAGVTGYTAIDHTVFQMSADQNNYAQLNFQNINTGSSASTDFVATADNGTDTDGYINLGINSSTFNDPAYPGFFPNDGYLVHHTATGSGNLIIFSHEAGSAIKLHVGEYGAANVRATVTNAGFKVNTSTVSTSITTGALIVNGGAGINGNIHAAAINNTPIGNTTPSTGVFTNLTGTDVDANTLVATNFSTGNARITGGYADNFPIGANTAASGIFTTANATTINADTSTIVTVNTTTANITDSKTTTGVVTNFSTGNAVISGGYLSGLANITATTGNVGAWYATTLNATNANITGAVALSSLNTANAVITGGYVNGLANLTATTTETSNFSTGNARITGGYADNFPIGANVPATGNFTTLSLTGAFISSGNIVAAAGTASSNTTTGALVVVGGAGVSGDINLGGNITAGNVIAPAYYSTGGTTRFQLSDIGLVTVDVAGVQFKFGASGIESSPGIYGGSFGGSKLSLNSETNLIANRLDVVKIQTGTDGSIQNEWTFSNNALTTPGGVTVNGIIAANGGNIVTLRTANFSTANAVITGGYINGLANLTATTTQTTNFSTGNAVITGGYINGLANLTATTTETTNFSTGNAVISGGYAQGLANVRATEGQFTNLSSGNVILTGGYLDNTPIGANTKATGAFTTLTSTGATTFTAATQSDNSTTGAVVVTGGVGIGANLNVGGNITVTGNLTVQGTTTTVNSTTVDVADLNITIAKGAASSAAANGAGLTVDGANATITYANSDDSWNFNKKVNLTEINATSANITNGNVTTLVATNFSSGNAVISGGYAQGLANVRATEGQFTNFSTGNAVISGGNIVIITPGTNTSYVQADHIEGFYGQFGNILSANVEITGGNVTNMWSVGTNNAIITGGAIDNTAIGFTTPETGNFTSANATLVTTYTGNIGILNSATANIPTLVATNFSTSNAWVTSGYADSFKIGPNTASTGNFTTANATTVTAYTVDATTQNVTDANVTTLVATNFSSGNSRISGGYADNFPLGANTASTGNFTTANATTVTAYTANVTTLNATFGNITNFSTPTIETGNITTWGANVTSGNITTLGAGTATIATLNTSDANIVNGNATTLVVTNFSTGNARVTGGYADNFHIGANTAATGTFTQVTVSGETKTATLNATSNVYLSPQSGAATVTINPLTPGNMDNMTVGATSAANVYASNFRAATSLWAATTGPVWIKGGTGTSGINSIPIGAVDPSTAVFTTLTATTANASTVNITNGNVTTLVATNFSTGNIILSGVTLSEGNIVANATTTSTNNTTGALVVRGGAGIGGNLFATSATNVTFGDNTILYNAYTILNNQGIYHEQGSGRRALQIRANDGSSGGGIASGDASGTFVYSANIISFATGTTVRNNLYPITLGNIGVVIGETGNLVAQSGIASTNTTTGALVVVGGAGIGGNLNIGGNINSSGNIVVNSTKSAATDFIVRGANENTLIYAVADTTYDQVSIGGNLTPSTVTQGAKLGVYSTDALLIPVGASAERPSAKGFTDVDGMIRFNNTSNQLEYYGSGQWNNTGSQFTVIQSRTFEAASGNPYGNVDGTNAGFTLAATASTAGTIVSVNGVLQIPDSAYSVSGSTLTFTEPPALGDVIDTRIITTTSSVTSLASTNGFNSIITDSDGVHVYTGNVSLGAVENWKFDTWGDFYPVTTANIGAPNKRIDYIFASNINIQGGTITGAGLSSGSLDDSVIGGNIARPGYFTTLSANETFTTNAEHVTDDIRGKYVSPGGTDAVYGFASATYRSGKFFVQLTDNSGSEYQAAEVICVHNGTTSSIEVYGVTYTGAANLAIFTSNIAGGTVYLNASSAGANLAIKVTPTLMKL